MASLFSRKQPNSREVLRGTRRDLANATRGIEREITALQQEEKKLVAEIKRTAKTGNESATKMLARQLVRLRQQIVKLQGSRAQMRGISTHTQSMHASASVCTGIRSAATAMGEMNKQLAPEKQIKIMQDFHKQSGQLDMMSEMMSDTMDDVLDEDGSEEETDLTNEILDEIGIDVSAQLVPAPRGKIAGKKDEEFDSLHMDDLEKRLQSLKN